MATRKHEDNGSLPGTYRGKKKRRGKGALLFIIILLAVGGAIAAYFGILNYKDKKDTLTDETVTPETTRTAETENTASATIMSTDDDFITPDLRFFNLHGRVKSVKYSGNLGLMRFNFDNHKIEYDEQGNFRNIKALVAAIFHCSESYVSIERNDEGYITRFEKRLPSGEISYYDFVWVDGHLKHFESKDGNQEADGTFLYRDDQLMTAQSNWETPDDKKSLTMDYLNYTEDEHGNWDRCEVECTGIMEFNEKDKEGNITVSRSNQNLTGTIFRTVVYD